MPEPRWLGVFVEDRIDEKAADYLVEAGYPKAVADQLGPTISHIVLVRDGAEFVQIIVTPAAQRSVARRFVMDEWQATPDPFQGDITVRSIYRWDELCRTLQSSFETTDGHKFSVDFVYNDNFTKITKYRRAGQVEAVQQMHRIA
ncbi:hypothetical protein RvY_04528 [Ramazzottius varieornatus]|uniref:Uncharacterized protein n=1 Tax=Ramazzottius varieornatus TaxID=947166 RepID=A0A1D1UVA2_RAMVA|nr:hypothetical protein RvY_04528 [Ramazzottius varieornatus]